MDRVIERDERTLTVENRSYRLGYLFLSFGLLASTAYRGIVRAESSWDLLALVIVGGVITTAYQGSHHVLSRRWVVITAAAVVGAALIAGALTL